MTLYRPALAFILAAAFITAPVSAQLWVEVAKLPGDISVELDSESVEEAMDGADLTLRGTFRKQMPNAMMETSVAVDCINTTAKIRSIRLKDGDTVLSETLSFDAAARPVGYGSAEAIYLEALCMSEVPEPPPAAETDEAEMDDALLEHEPLEDAPAGEAAE